MALILVGLHALLTAVLAVLYTRARYTVWANGVTFRMRIYSLRAAARDAALLAPEGPVKLEVIRAVALDFLGHEMAGLDLPHEMLDRGARLLSEVESQRQHLLMQLTPETADRVLAALAAERAASVRRAEP